MHIRFCTYVHDANARCDRGIFDPALDLWYDRFDRVYHTIPWQVYELHRELDWFNDHLATPRRFWYRPFRFSERNGVCWFDGRASEHVSRARYMCWLLQDLGVATYELRDEALQNVIWRDAYQAVALH